MLAFHVCNYFFDALFHKHRLLVVYKKHARQKYTTKRTYETNDSTDYKIYQTDESTDKRTYETNDPSDKKTNETNKSTDKKTYETNESTDKNTPMTSSASCFPLINTKHAISCTTTPREPYLAL